MENPIKQISAQKRLPTNRNCQVTLTNSDSIKFKIQFRNWLQEEKADQETNIKTNILTELERVATATSLRTEENPPPDASTAAATSSSGMVSADTGEPLLAAMACRTCSKKAEALSSNTIFHRYNTFFLSITTTSEWTERDENNSMKNQKYQANNDKSSNGSETQINRKSNWRLK